MGVKNYFAYAVMWLGSLIVVISGTCSLFVSLAGLPSLFNGKFVEFFSGIVMLAVFAGIPCLVGIGLYYMGKGMKDDTDES